MDEAFTALRLAAPAKLNLSLRVVGRRPDGFHDLDGVMVLLELADELRLAPGDEGLLVEPSGSGVPGEPAGNDLLAPARRLRPEIDDLVRLMLVAAGTEPHMSGSGPTLFALLDDAERADAVASRLRRDGVSTLRTRLRKEPASIETVAVSMKVHQ